jgi:amino acid permease
MPSTQKRIQIRPLTIVLIVVAIACVVAGAVYLTTAAKSLPAFFPGHDTALSGKHTKHGLAMFSLAVLALIGAWFTTAPSDRS